ncbi:MAG: SusD/RagB family nutrient-binding outer membrane lipoprotein [Tannerella sp.]|nr:SusD/RagB family nutrient-binding outer membrane lipoprotein [Tannerella sp.]
MKSIIRLYVAVLLLTMVSCNAGFEELNTPPTTFTKVDPGMLLAKAQREPKFHQGFEYQNSAYGSWIQHWNSSNNIPMSRYIFARWSWDRYYSDLRNVTQIRNHLLNGQEAEPEARTKLAIARIVEADIWQIITDLFGDIPFSESALGEQNLNPQPKYDTQESIYAALIQMVDEAVKQINPSDASYGSYDLYYGGQAEKWIKYGNSLKLHLGMRMKYVKPELAQRTVAEALSSPLIASNDDNALIRTNTDNTSSYHPMLQHNQNGSPSNRYLAEALVNRLVDTKDPRLTYIVAPTVNSVKAGEPAYRGKFVAPTDDEMIGVIDDDYSLTGPCFYLAYNQSKPVPYYVFTFAEICFYKAEAALEGWAGLTETQAEGFYQEGIRAAMALEPFNITEIPQEYIDAEFSLAGLSKEEKLEKIMTQKWILLFGRSIDAYAEWRRTGYPRLIPGHNLGSTNGEIPRRAGYPNDEILLNTKNYEEAVSRMSHGDTYLSRVWWDVR